MVEKNQLKSKKIGLKKFSIITIRVLSTEQAESLHCQMMNLSKASKAYCSTRKNDKYDNFWKGYNQSLPKNLKDYWSALNSLCRLEYFKSKKLFEKSYNSFNSKKDTKFLARSSLRRILHINRATGSRESVAKVYGRIVSFLEENGYESPTWKTNMSMR